MPQSSADRGEASAVSDILHTLRVRVLRASLTLFAVAVPVVDVVMVVQVLRAGALTLDTLLVSAHALLFPALKLASDRIGFRASALTLLGLALVTSLLVAVFGGVTVANTSMILLVVLLATLFFGRRGAALGLLAGMVTMVTMGAVAVTVGPGGSAPIWDPASAAYWLRQTVALGLFGLGFGVIELYVLERLVAEAQALRRVAEREQQQRLALEEAGRERQREQERRARVERALEESRRVEALARLAGGIAHDFNNTLTFIIGSAEMARLDLAYPDRVSRVLDQITQASNGAADLTHQLLALGRRELSNPQPVQLANLLRRLRDTFARVLPADIEIRVDVPDDALVVHVDPAQLERALFNLAINARDAMPSGGRLAISCRAETLEAHDRLADGRYVAIQVADTGEGIAPETLPHLFEPFFTTKAPGVGSGLGLAMVHAFVTEAGGAVDVVSTKPGGTTFTLWLRPSTAVMPWTTPAASSTARSVPATSGARVLIVEDDVQVRTLMAAILARHGFDVVEAPDGDAAIRALSERPDLTLMCIDAIMPGAAVTTVIERATTLAPDLRVLLCSGHVSDDLLHRGIVAGRYAFLAKPFSPQQLLASVRGLLDPGGAEDEGP